MTWHPRWKEQLRTKQVAMDIGKHFMLTHVWQSNVVFTVSWTRRSDTGHWDSLKARPIRAKERETLRMNPSRGVRKQTVICKFLSYLKHLEGLLEEESSAEDLGIIKPHTRLPRMTGWTLTGETIEAANPKALTERLATIPSEARLRIPGCKMKDVKDGFVKRKGKFRGKVLKSRLSPITLFHTWKVLPILKCSLMDKTKITRFTAGRAGSLTRPQSQPPVTACMTQTWVSSSQ